MDYCYVYQCDECNMYLGKLIRVLDPRQDLYEKIETQKKNFIKKCVFCGNESHFTDYTPPVMHIGEAFHIIEKNNKTFSLFKHI